MASRLKNIPFELDGGSCVYQLGGDRKRNLELATGGFKCVILADGPALKAHPKLCDGVDGPSRRLPGGESVKTPQHLDKCWQWLARKGLSRDGILVGVGGGAVLDLAGLAAGTWMRGVRFVSVPTTLLAMVDAAIGGKTALNAGGLKNPVGIFHAADHVIVDTDVLGSLPRAQWRNGLAELIKTALLGSPPLWRDMLKRSDDLAKLFAGGPARPRVAGALAALPWRKWIGQAARVKIDLVEEDFREAGPRQALNLGHTLGHALEIHHGCGHGAAVAAGMAAVTRTAVRRGLFPQAEARRLMLLLRACGLPTVLEVPPPARLKSLLAGDKKSRRDGLAWVLPVEPGKVLLDQRVEAEEIAADAAAVETLDGQS